MDNNMKNKTVICMVLGIASIVGCLFGYFSFVGIICGIVAIIWGNKLRKNPDVGNNYATIGFITGIIGTVISTIEMILIIILFSLFANIFVSGENKVFDIIKSVEDKVYSKDTDNNGDDSFNLAEKQEELDNILEEINDLNDDLGDALNEGDLGTVSNIQSKITSLTEEARKLEDEIKKYKNN